jgi:hypothetical protein
MNDSHARVHYHLCMFMDDPATRPLIVAWEQDLHRLFKERACPDELILIGGVDFDATDASWIHAVLCPALVSPAYGFRKAALITECVRDGPVAYQRTFADCLHVCLPLENK